MNDNFAVVDIKAPEAVRMVQVMMVNIGDASRESRRWDAGSCQLSVVSCEAKHAGDAAEALGCGVLGAKVGRGKGRDGPGGQGNHPETNHFAQGEDYQPNTDARTGESAHRTIALIPSLCLLLFWRFTPTVVFAESHLLEANGGGQLTT